ncbi:MAG: family metalloprotease precursor [Bacteroidota bacterium]|nr:family metalloprotease precursor [Bacteroidota bacterium]
MILLSICLMAKTGFSQWGQIPDKACYTPPSFGISYNSPNYFLTDSAAIYAYHTIGGNTQATTLSYYLCESTDDNVTAQNFSNGIGGLGCCSSKQIIPLNKNQVVYSQNSFLSTKVILKTNNSALTLFTVPGFENTFTATANQSVYCIWRKYTFTNNYLFFNRYINGGTYTDTLKYYGIKTMPKIYFSSDSVGYIFGKDAAGQNYVARTNNYGVSWAKVLVPVSEVTDLKFEGNTGYAVGAGGMVYQSLDNGINWLQAPGFTTKKLNSVSVMNSKCYIAGDSAALFHSFNFGLNWVQDTANISGNIDWVRITAYDQIYFQSSNKLYKKGYYSSVSEINKSKDFSLVLFPNPATDKINIQFPIAMGEKYTISVLNYLGQEIFMTENDTEIDIHNLASGMYSIIVTSSKKEFYRGTFIKTE